METIKLKAWDIHKKKFIPNDVWTLCNNPVGRETAVMTQDWEDYKEGEHFYPEFQTIVLYTGLHDKNGKEIYEGDIVKFGTHWVGDYTVKEHVEVIEYEAPGFNDSLQVGFHDTPPWCEVIGNIYENPELLNPTTL